MIIYKLTDNKTKRDEFFAMICKYEEIPIFAKKLEIFSETAIINWFNGKKNPESYSLKKLIEAKQLDIGHLIKNNYINIEEIDGSPLSNRLAELKERDRLTNASIGKIIGKSHSYVSNILHNHITPPISVIINLATYFDVPISYMLGEGYSNIEDAKITTDFIKFLKDKIEDILNDYIYANLTISVSDSISIVKDYVFKHLNSEIEEYIKETLNKNNIRL